MARHFTDMRALCVWLCWVAGLVLTGSTDAFLFMAPALLIAIPLLGGRYVGEELIAGLASRRRSRPSRPASCVGEALTPAPPTWPARGSHLIAFSLAKRPPPAALLPQN